MFGLEKKPWVCGYGQRTDQFGLLCWRWLTTTFIFYKTIIVSKGIQIILFDPKACQDNKIK
jgi:hypothetical protein